MIIMLSAKTISYERKPTRRANAQSMRDASCARSVIFSNTKKQNAPASICKRAQKPDIKNTIICYAASALMRAERRDSLREIVFW